MTNAILSNPTVQASGRGCKGFKNLTRIGLVKEVHYHAHGKKYDAYLLVRRKLCSKKLVEFEFCPSCGLRMHFGIPTCR